MWHGYFGIENLALTGPQKSDLITALQALGDPKSAQPAFRNHWRFRLDLEAAIFEARFDTESISVDSIKRFLGNIFDVDPGAIDHEVTTISDNTVIVFSYSGTDYLRMAFFGGIGCTWQQSRQKTIAYIKSNLLGWELGGEE
jgi:hypothetical protein